MLLWCSIEINQEQFLYKEYTSRLVPEATRTQMDNTPKPSPQLLPAPPPPTPTTLDLGPDGSSNEYYPDNINNNTFLINSSANVLKPSVRRSSVGSKLAGGSTLFPTPSSVVVGDVRFPSLVERTCDVILKYRNHSCIDFSEHLIKLLPFNLVDTMFQRLIARGEMTDALFLVLLRPRDRGRLQLRGCNYLRKSVLRQAIFHCHQLVSLDVGRCYQVNNNVLRAVLQNTPKLKTLRVDDCKQLSDAAFQQDLSLFSTLSGLISLEELNISGCNQISDSVLTWLAKFSSNLRILIMARCKGITHVGVQDVLYSLASLQTLNVSFCPQVNDEAFKILGRINRSNLTVLYADNCNIGDETLHSVAHGCKHLKSATFRWCHGVTDKGVTLLAEGCREIEAIDISSCYEVTDTAVDALSKSCVSLKSLSVSFCSKVTHESLRYAEKFTKLQSFETIWTATNNANDRDSNTTSGRETLPTGGVDALKTEETVSQAGTCRSRHQGNVTDDLVEDLVVGDENVS